MRGFLGGGHVGTRAGVDRVFRWLPIVPARLAHATGWPACADELQPTRDFLQSIAGRSWWRTRLPTVRFVVTLRDAPGTEESVMPATSMSSRLFSAALAAFLSLGLLFVVSEQLNPQRLAATVPVVQLEPIVVTAPAPAAASMAAAEVRTVAN
jgi:hypothetical protein